MIADTWTVTEIDLERETRPFYLRFRRIGASTQRLVIHFDGEKVRAWVNEEGDGLSDGFEGRVALLP